MTKFESDDTKIALINSNISYIQKDIAEIKLSLKDTYATRFDLVQIAKETESRFTRLERASNLWKFLSPTLATITGSVLTFLLIQYIANLK